MSLSDAVSKAIQENLNGMVAAELQAYLTEAEAVKKERDGLRALLAAAKEMIVGYNAKDGQYDDMQRGLKNLADERAKFQAEQLKFSHVKAEHPTAVALAEMQGFKEAVNLFLRVPTIRTATTKDVGVPIDGVSGSQHGSGSVGYVSRSVDTMIETKTEE